jgi:hypothetical protein
MEFSSNKNTEKRVRYGIKQKIPPSPTTPPQLLLFVFLYYFKLFFWVMELVQLSKFDCVVAHTSFLFSLLLCLLCCSTSSWLLPIFCPSPSASSLLFLLLFFSVAESCISCPNFSFYNSPYKKEGNNKPKRVVTTKGSDGGPSYKAWLLLQQTVEIV